MFALSVVFFIIHFKDICNILSSLSFILRHCCFSIDQKTKELESLFQPNFIQFHGTKYNYLEKFDPFLVIELDSISDPKKKELDSVYSQPPLTILRIDYERHVS